MVKKKKTVKRRRMAKRRRLVKAPARRTGVRGLTKRSSAKRPRKRVKPKKARLAKAAPRQVRKVKKEEKWLAKVVRPKLTVIGIGGGGCSIVAEIAPRIRQANFVAANTDRQALKAIRGPVRIFQFGQEITSGLGTGMNPRLGEVAARKEKARIKEIVEKTDLCILVGCLGGGTGSGAAPVFAEIAQGVSTLCLGIFTLPFEFEGQKRLEIARTSLEKMRSHLNALVIVPNERIFQIIDKTTSLEKAFSIINSILAEAMSGLMETIYRPSLINIDFADLKMVMEGRGRLAFLNCSLAQGKERSAESSRKVLKNPLQAYDISGAERILFNIAGGRDLKMSEVEHISKEIAGLSKRAKVIFGISQIPGLGEKIKITVLGIGCGKKPPSTKVLEARPSLAKVSAAKSAEARKPKVEQAKKQVPAEAEKVKEMPGRNISHSEAAEPKKESGEKPPSASSHVSPAPVDKKVSEDKKEPEKKSVPKSKEPVKPSSESKAALLLGKVVPEAKLRRVRLKRNALEVKKAVEEAEQEILKKEEAWESPAFLRRGNR